MKIAISTDQYRPRISGQAIAVDTWKKELESKGNEMHVLCPEYPQAGQTEHAEHSVHRSKARRVLFSPEDMLVRRSQKRALFACLDSIAPDVIHIHSEFSIGMMAADYAVLHNIPAVMNVQTDWETLAPMCMPFVPSFVLNYFVTRKLGNFYRRATRLIVPTKTMYNLLKKYNLHEKSTVIPVGTNIKKFQAVHEACKNGKSEFHSRYPFCRDKKVLLYAGRLGREKNIGLLADIMIQLKDTHPDTVLVIAGDGPHRTSLESLFRRRGISDRVFFTGFLRFEQLVELYTHSDVFVFPSKVESQGLVITEAMACGLPVVAIGLMGVRDVMNGNNGGFMVSDSPDDFYRHTALLLSDETVRLEKSREAYLHAALYDITALAAKLHSAFSEAICASKK